MNNNENADRNGASKSACCGGHDHAGHRPSRPHRRDRARSRLRHDRGSRDQQAPLRLSRRDLSFLLGRLPHQIRGRSPRLSGKGQPAEGRGAGRHDLHLPDASRDPPGRPGKLPDLRHGAGAGGREPRCAAESGTRRHDAPLLGRPRARAAGGRPGNGRPSRRRPWLGRSDAVELDPVRVCDARRAVGRLAVLRARLAVARHAQSQHVHADRDGHRRGLCLQPHRHRRARNLPGHLPRPWRRGCGLFRSGRRHHRAGTARPGA